MHCPSAIHAKLGSELSMREAYKASSRNKVEDYPTVQIWIIQPLP